MRKNSIEEEAKKLLEEKRRFQKSRRNYEKEYDDGMKLLDELSRNLNEVTLSNPSKSHSTENSSTNNKSNVNVQVFIQNQVATENDKQKSNASTDNVVRSENRKKSNDFHSEGKSTFIVKDNYAKNQIFMGDAIAVNGSIMSIDAAIEYASKMPDTEEKTEILMEIKNVLENSSKRTKEEIKDIMNKLNAQKNKDENTK